MTPEQFCYWLQGYYELSDEGRGLSQKDHTIRDHLKTVFEKATPSYTHSEPLTTKYVPPVPFPGGTNIC